MLKKPRKRRSSILVVFFGLLKQFCRYQDDSKLWCSMSKTNLGRLYVIGSRQSECTETSSLSVRAKWVQFFSVCLLRDLIEHQRSCLHEHNAEKSRFTNTVIGCYPRISRIEVADLFSSG